MAIGESTRSKSYEDLVAWQRAMDLVDAVYVATRNWPPDERFGLTSQIRRAVVSVPANIAEGQGRNGRAEFAHHLGIANGSLSEVETMIRIATRQRFHSGETQDRVLEITRETGRLIHGLLRSLKATDRR